MSKPFSLERRWYSWPLLCLAMALAFASSGIASAQTPGKLVQCSAVPTDEQTNAEIQRMTANLTGVSKATDIVFTRMHTVPKTGDHTNNFLRVTYTTRGGNYNEFVTFNVSTAMFLQPGQPWQWNLIGWSHSGLAEALSMANTTYSNSGMLPAADGWIARDDVACGTPTPTGTITPRPSATTSPTRTPATASCTARISVPANLKPGDTLSPSADVSSTDGKPIQGSVGLVWTINGVQANSVTWDGKEATIRLDLSCQGRAQTFSHTVPAFGAPTPAPVTPAPVTPAPVTPAPVTPGQQPGAGSTGGQPGGGTTGDQSEDGDVPGLGSAGDLPGPKDAGQGLIGMVLPGLLGLLGALLAGAGSGGASVPAGGATEAPKAPEGGLKGAAPGAADKGQPGAAGEKPTGAPAAPLSPAARAQAAAQKAAAAQAAAADANSWGSILSDAAGRAASQVGGGIVSGVKAVDRGFRQIGDAVTNPSMFFKGLKTEISSYTSVARPDADTANQALKDGRYGDYLSATASGMGKILGKMGGTAVDFGKGLLPIAEVKTLFDPKASFEDKALAVSSGAIKTIGVLSLTGLGRTPIPGLSGASRTAPAAAAGQAARAAAAEGTSAADSAAAGSAGAGRTAAGRSPGWSASGADLQAPGARTLVNAPGGVAPQMQGIPRAQADSLANIAQRRNVQIAVRPSNPAGTPWLESGRAVPKPPDVHVTSLTDADALIGGPSGRNGLVGHFKPEFPTNIRQMSPELQTAVRQRYAQRYFDWQRYEPQLQRMQQQGRVTVSNGVVYDGASGKPLVTDTDLGGIYRNGAPVPQDEARLIVNEVRRSCPGVTHGDVNSWYALGPEQRQILNNTMGKHTPGNTPLSTVGPDGTWQAGYFGDKVAP